MIKCETKFSKKNAIVNIVVYDSKHLSKKGMDGRIESEIH